MSKETVLSERLARASQMADHRLDRMENIVTSKGDDVPMHQYLPAAIARAKVDPEFAVQLKDSLDRYAALHRAVWGGKR